MSHARPRYRAGARTYAFEHRAFARLDHRARTLLGAVVLTVAASVVWVAALPAVARLWGHALVWGAERVGLGDVTVMRIHDVWGWAVAVPHWELSASLPGVPLLFGVGFGTLVLYLALSFLPERWRPGVYLLRAVLLVQASAVLYFAVWPELFPYTLSDYLHGMMATGLAIATAIPVVLGLTFYVQDLNLAQKAAFTALALGYSVVLVPLQYAFQGLAISGGTLLWMPALYLFLGVPLHVLALVALYAWAMSWPGRLPTLGVPADADPTPAAPTRGTVPGFPASLPSRSPTPVMPDFSIPAAARWLGVLALLFLGATTVQAQVDLSLSASAAPATIDVGDTVTFTVVVSNPSGTRVRDLEVSAPVPAGLTFVSSTDTRGSYNSGTGVWAFDRVNGGSTQTLTITASAPTDGSYTLTAAITTSDTPDPNTANDSDDAAVTVRPPLTPQPGVCYAVADNGGANGGNDWLIITTRDGSQQATIGTGTGTNNIETAAYWPGSDLLYAANANTLGTIDLTTGVYTSIGAFGSADGAEGSIAITDVDGLAFDPFTGWLYGSHRREGATPNPLDLLVRIDPATGLVVPDAFGAGVDYVVINSAAVGERDIDDIAIDSEDGTLYAIANGGTADRLVAIDKSTGAVTDVGLLGVTDMEGFAFDAFGTLFGSTGAGAALYTVDKPTGTATFENAFDAGADHESVACLTDGVNDLAGTLFRDDDASGTYAPGTDTALAGRSVTLYRDADGSGTLTAGDVALATQTTDGAGAYSWTMASEGDFVVVPEDLTAGGGAWTTPDERAASFSGFGNSSTGLDFGYSTVADLSVGIAVDDATPPLGADVTFTVTLTNDGPSAASGAVVSAPLPAGYTFVSSDGGVAYDDATGTWTVPGALANGASTTLDVVATTGTTASRTMTAELTAADQPDLDSTPNNGVGAEDDQASVSVVGQPTDLALTMGIDDPAPTVGDVVTFTLTLTNESGTDATGVQVSAPFIARADTVTVVGSTPSAGTYDNAFWTVGPLAAGATVTLDVQVRLDQDLIAFTALAEVSLTDQPDVDSTPYNGITAEDDYASATATTGGASTAGEGGLESNGSMARKLAAVLYGRRTAAAARADRGLAAPPIVALRASPLALRGAGLAVPRFGPGGSTPVEVSPTDLLPVTNAIDVVAADYIRPDGRRVGAAFVTLTAPGEVYEHTKPVCDRLRGGRLDGVERVTVAGHPLVLTRLTQADGSVDYAISFVVYEADGKRTVDSRFLLQEYDTAAMTGDVINIQVWGPSRAYAAELAAGALGELAAGDALTFRTATEPPALPAVFVRSGRYQAGRLVLDLYNTAGATELTLSGGTLTRAEGARPETFSRTVDIPAGTADDPTVTVAVETGPLFDAAFFVGTDASDAPDRLYLADGTWGVALDPASAAARLDRFQVQRESGAPLPGAQRVERAIAVEGQMDSWATVYRTLAPGSQAVDLSAYAYVEFEASGSGAVHVLLQQAAIATSDHFGKTVRLDATGGRHRIWFSDLHLADGSRGFDGTGVVTLSLTARTDGAAPFAIAVSDVRFGGGAADLATAPDALALLAPAPNPFVASTRLRFDLDADGPVLLRVFDVLGREVARPLDGPLAAGRHEAAFDGSGLAAGVYVVRLDTGGQTLVRRMTRLR